MSLRFSNTSSPYNGIIQQLEFKLFGDDGLTRISGNSALLGQMTSRVNLALDEAFAHIFQADGRWQFDDSNHTDYPIIYTNIVSGQRDYPFTTDANSNLILAIDKLAILPSATATTYTEILPSDANQDRDSNFVVNNTSITGVPFQYDLLANGIFLDPIPSYNATAGIKAYISREASYFATTDTTKKPGFAGNFHMFLVYHVAYNYAADNGLAGMQSYYERMKSLEGQMIAYYGKRHPDEAPVMKGKKIKFI